MSLNFAEDGCHVPGPDVAGSSLGGVMGRGLTLGGPPFPPGAHVPYASCLVTVETLRTLNLGPMDGMGFWGGGTLGALGACGALPAPGCHTFGRPDGALGFLNTTGCGAMFCGGLGEYIWRGEGTW